MIIRETSQTINIVFNYRWWRNQRRNNLCKSMLSVDELFYPFYF